MSSHCQRQLKYNLLVKVPGTVLSEGSPGQSARKEVILFPSRGKGTSVGVRVLTWSHFMHHMSFLIILFWSDMEEQMPRERPQWTSVSDLERTTVAFTLAFLWHWACVLRNPISLRLTPRTLYPQMAAWTINFLSQVHVAQSCRGEAPLAALLAFVSRGSVTAGNSSSKAQVLGLHKLFLFIHLVFVWGHTQVLRAYFWFCTKNHSWQ